ncbi:MAG: CPBP family intramembrane metalloprotease [Planctomycetota bacterium]|nr:MAG: CPBP family intramembrane metalloprotease [Planctomycetota bacterium]REK23614.1 MAG: CPBP family intramembrane metalloprotease [Planctomycetota bacterium]REK31159.1 MAG: CPBP family intramembrane metalloprotease [Planctomycetota bacterium]
MAGSVRRVYDVNSRTEIRVAGRRAGCRRTRRMNSDLTVENLREEQGMLADAQGELPRPTARTVDGRLLPYALIGLLPMIAYRVVNILLVDDPLWMSSVVPFVASVLLLVFTPLYAVWAIRRTGARVFVNRLRWGEVLIECAIAFGVWLCVIVTIMILGVVYTQFLENEPEVPAQFEEIVFSRSVPAFLWLAGSACLWAPICEELFFRRMILRAFYGHMSLVVAVGLQALIFALLHDYQWLQLTNILILGLALGGVYAWRKTLLTPMLVHFMQNTMATSVLGVLFIIGYFAPVLGVTVEDDAEGCRITAVIPESPAADVGLQAGDVVTHVGRTRIRSSFEFHLWLALNESGQPTRLQVLRNGESLTLRPVLVSIEELPQP